MRQGTLVLRDADVGSAAEVRRDFARYFSAAPPTHRLVGQAPVPTCTVYLASTHGGTITGTGTGTGDAPVRPRPFRATVPNCDFTAESNDRTVANFRDLFRQEVRRACRAHAASSAGRPAMGQVQDGNEEADLTGAGDACVRRLVQCIGTRVAFEIAVVALGYAALSEPTFCILLSPGAPRPRDGAGQASRGNRAQWACHVVTFAFATAPPPSPSVRGTWTGTVTAARTVLRISSSNLADADEDQMRFEYALFAAERETPAEELLAACARGMPGLVGLDLVRAAPTHPRRTAAAPVVGTRFRTLGPCLPLVHCVLVPMVGCLLAVLVAAAAAAAALVWAAAARAL